MGQSPSPAAKRHKPLLCSPVEGPGFELLLHVADDSCWRSQPCSFLGLFQLANRFPSTNSANDCRLMESLFACLPASEIGSRTQWAIWRRPAGEISTAKVTPHPQVATASLRTASVRHSAFKDLSSDFNSGFIGREKVETQLCKRCTWHLAVAQKGRVSR